MNQQDLTREINQLKREGYSDEEIDSAMAQLNNAGLFDSSNQQQIDPLTLSQPSSFISQKETDLGKWQLELNDILERIEHILRGDIPKYHSGTLIWSENPDPNENPLNGKGIREVLKVLVLYINRNTILSDYDDKEIRLKVYDFGRRLNNLFFMKYDDMGLDSEEKRKSYPIIVGLLVDIVHSTYKRALMGGERRSLREMIQISQSSQMPMYPNPYGYQSQPKERSVLNPNRYLKGRFIN